MAVSNQKEDKDERPLERDRRPVVPDPWNPEVSRLRRFYIGPLLVSRFRRRQQYVHDMHLQEYPRAPSPDELATFAHEHSDVLKLLPREALLELCRSAAFRIAFAGEPVIYANEPSVSHGIVLLLDGHLGVMQRGKRVTTEEAATGLGLLHELLRMGQTPSTQVTLLASTAPDQTFHGPCVFGESLALCEGTATACVRVMSRTARFAVLHPPTLHRLLSLAEPAVLRSVFTEDRLSARAAALGVNFRQTVPLLTQCWVCQDMSAAELNDVISALQPAIFLPGEDIVRKGEQASTMFFVRRGFAQVYVDGRPVPNALVGPGKTFGEMGVLFREPRMATIRAVSLVDTWVLTKEILDRIICHSPAKSKISSHAAAIRVTWIAKLNREHLKAPLRALRVFAHAPPAAIDQLVDAASAKVYTPGQLVTSTTTVCTEIVLIHSGTCVTQDAYATKYGPGSVLGRFALCPHRGVETVAAATMVDAFTVPRKTLERILKKCDAWNTSLERTKRELELFEKHAAQPTVVRIPRAVERAQRWTTTVEVLERLAPQRKRCDGVAPDDARDDSLFFVSPKWKEGAKVVLRRDPNFIERLALLPSRTHRVICNQLLQHHSEVDRFGSKALMPTRCSVVLFERFGKPSAVNGSLGAHSVSRPSTPVGSNPTAEPSPEVPTMTTKQHSSVFSEVDDIMQQLFETLSPEDLAEDVAAEHLLDEADFVEQHWATINAATPRAQPGPAKPAAPRRRATTVRGDQPPIAPTKTIRKEQHEMPLDVQSAQMPRLIPPRQPAEPRAPGQPRKRRAAAAPRRKTTVVQF